MGKKTAMEIGEAKEELKAQIIEQALKKVEQMGVHSEDTVIKMLHSKLDSIVATIRQRCQPGADCWQAARAWRWRSKGVQ